MDKKYISGNISLFEMINKKRVEIKEHFTKTY